MECSNNIELNGHDSETRRDHWTPCAYNRSVDTNNEEHDIFLPKRPIERIPRTITRLGNQNNILILSSSMFKMSSMRRYNQPSNKGVLLSWRFAKSLAARTSARGAVPGTCSRYLSSRTPNPMMAISPTRCFQRIWGSD
jgi:hypothetical protein